MLAGARSMHHGRAEDARECHTSCCHACCADQPLTQGQCRMCSKLHVALIVSSLPCRIWPKPPSPMAPSARLPRDRLGSSPAKPYLHPPMPNVPLVPTCLARETAAPSPLLGHPSVPMSPCSPLHIACTGAADIVGIADRTCRARAPRHAPQHEPHHEPQHARALRRVAVGCGRRRARRATSR